MCCTVFSGSPGLYPLNASSSPPPTVTTTNVSRRCQMSPGGQTRLLLRTTGAAALNRIDKIQSRSLRSKHSKEGTNNKHAHRENTE